MIGRTIALFGIIASVMALSSMVYGAFHEPLEPYMKGIMGGVMEVYRTMRSGFFSGAGRALSALINILANWLTGWPQAPWFYLPEWLEDGLTAYTISGGACVHAVNNRGKPRQLSPFLRAAFIVSWPALLIGFIIGVMENPRSSEDSNFTRTVMRKVMFDWGRFVGAVVIGAVIFFLLVYAENRIGL